MNNDKCEMNDSLQNYDISKFDSPVTKAWTSSISFCFSSASKLLYHLAKRVLPALFWINMNLIGIMIYDGRNMGGYFCTSWFSKQKLMDVRWLDSRVQGTYAKHP